jgi:diguanylate cyclase (GGDEF)-like protein
MNPRQSPPPGNATEEVSSLIATLHETGQRLEELTAGEVDAVADRDGKTFLLGRAQEQLRHIDSAKQAAILNALPANIALLDSRGIIVSVNEAWRQFGEANSLLSPGHAVGVNYLEICDSARGDSAVEARAAASGTRSVLLGAAKSFELEYSCDSPTEQRWFLMTVTPLAGGRQQGAVVMHLNITDRKAAQLEIVRNNRKLHDSEASVKRLNRIYAVLSGINTLIVRVRDRDELYRESCRIAVEAGGFRMSLIAIVDQGTKKLVPVASAGKTEQLLADIKKILSSNEDAPKTMVARAIREKKAVVSNRSQSDPQLVFGKSYSLSEIRSLAVLPLMVSGEAVGVLALYSSENDFFHEDELKLLTELADDISFAQEHLSRQEKIVKLARIRAVSSEINALIVRARDPQELFDDACGIAVEHGNFGLAWIGRLDPATLVLTPVSWAGVEAKEYLFKTSPAANGALPLGEGLASRTIRERRTVFSNDMLADMERNSARRTEALQRGYRSLIALPLIVDGAAVGNLSLFTSEINFFDDEEVRLLGELAGNISFALDNISRQMKLDKLARIRAISGEINAAIVRIRERDALLRETCRIAVEHGKFELVWIGTVDTAKQQIEPVAWNGFPEAVAQRVSWKSASTAGGALGEAIRTAKPAVRNDIETEISAGGMRAAALRMGYLSTVCLPFVVDDNVVALMSIFAAGKGFFDEDELALLNEVSADVSFALQSIEKQKKLEYLSYYDVLTGLPNRALFHEALGKTLALASDRNWLVAVMCIDLDYFKNVNDTLGHGIGDELLVQFSARLLKCVRIRDTVGRLGGDEFSLILLMEDGKEGAAHVANKIRDALCAPFDLKGHAVTVTASVGITIHPDDASDPETLMKYADTAMYRAKQAGRNTYRFFTAQMNTEVVTRLDLETALRKAVENDEFVLHYQPKVQLHSGRISGLEALLRWQRPGHGLVSPHDFIPVLEETGLILRVGSWVVATACKQIGLWMRSPIGPVQVSVNVSGRQFIEGDLHGDIVKALGDNGIAANLLELEMTESSLMANTGRTIASLQNLRKLGVQVSIDDFGTGYSSLAYLSRFPIDILKIDIAFIRDVTSNPDHAAIVLAIIRMAHGLKLNVVAEGVETAAQLAYLRRHHCDFIQGYYFSRPLPLPELEQLLHEGKRLPAPDAVAQMQIRTLLLVDDDADALTVLQHLLREDGYQILSARSAAEGFELLALHPVQVILCDQNMPGMSGTVFLDRVKDLYPDTFRVILSGHTDLESIMDAINHGAVHRYYTKQWDDKLARKNIQEAFRQHRLLHDTPLGRHGADPGETIPPGKMVALRARANEMAAYIPARVKP